MTYQHTNAKGQAYYLHSKEVKLRGSGKTQQIFYFAKQPGQGALDNVPSGYRVVENPRTGLPFLKKD